MLLHLIQFLPNDIGRGVCLLAIFSAIIGSGLWIAGAKISRPLITLLTVLIGAILGNAMPKWFGWQISGAGPAVGGAVLLGASGFILHRLWIGVGLGFVLALWACLAIWLTLHDGQPWDWPKWDAALSSSAYARLVWKSVPPDVGRVLPIACALSLIAGIAAAILWPKLTTVLNWSGGGLTLALIAGLGVIGAVRREWLAKLPQQTSTQLIVLVALVFIGAAAQWRLAPRFAGTHASGSEKSDETNDP